MTTADPAIATLEVKIENLTLSISQLNRSVEQNNEKLERLSILEVSHTNSDKAIERAFSAISKVETSLIAHVGANEAAHTSYNKWIWMAVGFCAAVSILWTLVGYRLNGVIDEVVKATYEMRTHLHDDKIKDASDLLKFHNDARGLNGIAKP